MKKIATFIAFLALVGTFSINAFAHTDDVKKAKTQAEALAALNASEAAAVDAATWKVFSKNLIHALRMDNDGVKTAAMQYIIRYNTQLDVDEAAIDVARLYREHEDDNVRRMAVVALGKMQSDWAIGYLRLSKNYEKSETIRQTMQAVIAEQGAAKAGPTAKIGV